MPMLLCGLFAATAPKPPAEPAAAAAAPVPLDLPNHADVVKTIKSVADYYLHEKGGITNKECGWTHGAFMQGSMAAFRATNSSSYIEYAKWWGETNGWITCNYPNVLTEHAAANDMSCGQTFAEIYMHEKENGNINDTYIASIRDKVLKVLVNRPQIDDWWWDDAYFMAMGAFSRIGHISGDTAFHDKLFALYNDSATRRGLWSTEDHLYFRDETYKNKTTPNGKHVFWGRGNGWAAGALARTLEYVPHSHPSYQVYVSHLQMMADALKAVQSADGMWRASVLDPTDPHCPNPETTGTSGMAFGLAYGVNSGILDRATYQPMVLKAWRGLTTMAVHDSGLLGYCQPVGGGPEPSTSNSTSDFCVGLFLLAAEQIALMAN